MPERARAECERQRAVVGDRRGIVAIAGDRGQRLALAARHFVGWKGRAATITSWNSSSPRCEIARQHFAGHHQLLGSGGGIQRTAHELDVLGDLAGVARAGALRHEIGGQPRQALARRRIDGRAGVRDQPHAHHRQTMRRHDQHGESVLETRTRDRRQRDARGRGGGRKAGGNAGQRQEREHHGRCPVPVHTAKPPRRRPHFAASPLSGCGTSTAMVRRAGSNRLRCLVPAIRGCHPAVARLHVEHGAIVAVQVLVESQRLRRVVVGLERVDEFRLEPVAAPSRSRAPRVRARESSPSTESTTAMPSAAVCPGFSSTSISNSPGSRCVSKCAVTEIAIWR